MNNIADIKQVYYILLLSKYLWSIYKCYTWINYIIFIKKFTTKIMIYYISNSKI